MWLLVVLLLLALLIFGVGFTAHVLWWLLILIVILAVLGFLFRGRY